MQIEISPKRAFQENEVLVIPFRALAVNAAFHSGVLYAIAEYSMAHQPGKEELAAVKAFVDTLLNLGEKDEPVATFPARTLSYGHPPPQPQKQ